MMVPEGQRWPEAHQAGRTSKKNSILSFFQGFKSSCHHCRAHLRFSQAGERFDLSSCPSICFNQNPQANFLAGDRPRLCNVRLSVLVVSRRECTLESGSAMLSSRRIAIFVQNERIFEFRYLVCKSSILDFQNKVAAAYIKYSKMTEKFCKSNVVREIIDMIHYKDCNYNV